MSAFVEVASGIAREAGALIRDYSARGIGFELKSQFDLVTEADRNSEKLIVARLRERFPDHDIIAEEGGGGVTGSEYRWHVDPLDGTTNFAHGFPMFAVSLGLERAGERIAGVVYDPTRDELFAAERGAGSTLNGAAIKVSPVERLAETLVATGFPTRNRPASINVYFFQEMALRTHGVRRPGAAALDLAYVACGRLDAFWEFGLNSWDVAAGLLLVEEAGGAVSDMHGARHALDAPTVLADNGSVHGEIVPLFAAVFRGELSAPLPPLPGRAK